MRRVVCVAALAFACAATAQQYPTKPVRIVIQYPPGGAVDALARAIGNELNKLWGQPVLVDGKPGAGAVIAATAVAHSAPDGYTIFLTDQQPLAITPFLQRDLPYDPVKDFAAVIGLVTSSSVFVVPRDFPVNAMAELISAAKAKPGAINFGSWGVGSTAHLDPEEFAAMLGISMTHVPYKGLADMLRGALAGEIQTAFISLGAALPHIKSGRLKPLAYGALKRSAHLPDVPTIAESTLPGFEVNGWLGLIVPAATPRAVINRIAADAGRVVSVPAVKETFIEGVGFEMFNLPAEPFAKLIEETRSRREVQLKRLRLRTD